MWEETNDGFKEERLIALGTLSFTSTGYWESPDNLKLNAATSYYWGVKRTNEVENGLPSSLYLYGLGSRKREWSAGLNICRSSDDVPSVCFIPQIPNEGEYHRWWQEVRQFAREKLLRQSLLLGKIGPNRMYVFGISGSGYDSQRLALLYTGYWAAAGPVTEGEPLENASAENCSNTALSLWTGDKDTEFCRNTPTRYAREVFDSLAH